MANEKKGSSNHLKLEHFIKHKFIVGYKLNEEGLTITSHKKRWIILDHSVHHLYILHFLCSESSISATINGNAYYDK